MQPRNTNAVLKAVIIDDEYHGRENLKSLFKDYCPEIELLGMADSVVAGKQLVENRKPDVVFLDITMPNLDGFDFLDLFDERDFAVVFVSAHEEYGIKALKAGAFDYLLKPVSIKELKLTTNKLLENLHCKQTEAYFEYEKLVIPASHGFNILKMDEIIRVTAEGSYTRVFTKDTKSMIVSRTLKEFEDAVPSEKFFRIHKSHLINLLFVKEYSTLDGYFVIMSDGSKVEISRRKAHEFTKKIKEVLNAL